MKQYCRYCAYCCYGDEVYCEKSHTTMSERKAKSANKCKYFVFNEIDVFNFNNVYKERKSRKLNEFQLEFEEIKECEK